MSKGGARQGAGRKKGSKSTRTQEIIAEAKANGETPLEYMLRVMRDTQSDDKRRDSMAAAAAPFIHPRLAAVEVSGDKENPICHEVVYGDADAFTGRIARLSARAGEGKGAEGSEH